MPNISAKVSSRIFRISVGVVGHDRKHVQTRLVRAFCRAHDTTAMSSPRRQKMRAVLRLGEGRGSAGGKGGAVGVVLSGGGSGGGPAGGDGMDVEAVLDQCYTFSASEGLESACQSLKPALQSPDETMVLLLVRAWSWTTKTAPHIAPPSRAPNAWRTMGRFTHRASIPAQHLSTANSAESNPLNL